MFLGVLCPPDAEYYQSGNRDPAHGVRVGGNI